MVDRTAPARDRATRTADTLAKLTTPALDGWVSTADASGTPYLVPLSVTWIDERVVLSMGRAMRTARNLEETRAARVGVGPTRDVVMIDATLERSLEVEDDEELGTAYAAQADWDPRGMADYHFYVLRPVRIQAWREVNEIQGRVLMKDGQWLDR